MTEKTKNRSCDPVCSVCIANYNGVGYMEECIRSVIEQDFQFPFEIIVHDDASCDRSVEVLRNEFPEIILIESETNVGFCISNNRMAARSKGKYILFLNNDATLFPDALNTFHENAESEKDICIYGLRQFDAATGELIDFGIFLDPFLNSIPNRDLRRRDVGMVMGACLWVPRIIWEKTGGFPGWFKTMHEDMYICCFARLYGYPVRVIPKSGYRHWVGKSLGGGKIVNNQVSTTLKRRALSERNRIYVIVLCYPEPLFSVLFPCHIIVLLLEGIFLSFVKRNLAIFKDIYLYSIISFWKNRKKLIRIRNKIKKNGVINFINIFSLMRPIPQKLRILIVNGLPEIM